MININLVCIPCICLSTEAVGLALCGLGDDVVTLDTVVDTRTCTSQGVLCCAGRGWSWCWDIRNIANIAAP